MHIEGNEITTRTEESLNKLEKTRKIAIETLGKMGAKWDVHMPLFCSTASIARILWLEEIVAQIKLVPGDVIEFGSQWGASLNVIAALMKIQEPYNPSRRLVSFSTFEEGFVGVDENLEGGLNDGLYATTNGWHKQLVQLMRMNHEGLDFECVPGDASQNIKVYLERQKSRLIALCHFDMDIYKPTKDCLEAILPHMVKGGILVFDELNCSAFPGETRAVLEVLGRDFKIRRTDLQPYSCFVIVE